MIVELVESSQNKFISGLGGPWHTYNLYIYIIHKYMLYVCILKNICNMYMIYVSFESISFHLIAKTAPKKIPRPDSPEKSHTAFARPCFLVLEGYS